MNAFMRMYSPLIHRAVFALTLAIVAGSAAYADSTSFVSDDFNTRNLKRPLWEFADPEGDSGIRMVNTGTDSASLQFILPAGNAHDISSSGYRVPRVTQACADTDFRVEAKFLTSVVGGSLLAYQVQGIVVEQDANNVIRFDFTTGTTPNIRVYAATFIGGFGSGVTRINQEIVPYGTAPLWLRVERVGNDWTQSYSLDGTNWTVAGTFTQALAVARVGVWAGNAGVRPPAYVSRVDYFLNADNPGLPEDTLMDVADDTAPLVHNIRATQVAPNALELAWSTDELSTGVMNYGSTPAYGSTASSLTLAYDHKVFLTGLLSNTSYDFQITATDDSANSEATGNNIEKTAVYKFDAATVSDDFNGASLASPLWTPVDPIGDASIGVSGGNLSISVPPGVQHDIWTSGARAPRIMQAIAAGVNIMEIEAKFATGVTGNANAFQLEGILVEQDSNNMIRFDFVNGSGNTKAFAASFTNGFTAPVIHINTNILSLGAAPLYLKVKQLGAQWTLEYSLDGISWTQGGTFWHILQPTKVGVFAGNAGSSAPGFTSQVEYFKAVLPSPAALSSPANGSTDLDASPTLTWLPALGATAYELQVATDTLMTSVVLSDQNVAGTSRVATGLNYLTKYFWRVRGKSGAGVGEYSEVWSFTTRTSAPNTPALVSPADGASGQPTALTLVWHRIPTATSYRVQVSTEGTFTTGLIVDDPAMIDTVKSLTGLALGTQYFWRVNASSPGGTSDYSSTFSFTTVASIPGSVTLLTPENGASADAASVTFTWQAAAGATKYWHELAVDPLFQFVVVDSTLSGTSKTITGLIANQTYYWRVKAGNISGWGPYSEGRNFIAITVGVRDERGIPTSFGVSQNYPNPFNPATTIEFAVPSESHVTIDVYNAIGERVATLLDEPRGAGYHRVSFDASSLPSGLYLYRMSAGQFTSVRKMLLMK